PRAPPLVMPRPTETLAGEKKRLPSRPRSRSYSARANSLFPPARAVLSVASVLSALTGLAKGNGSSVGGPWTSRSPDFGPQPNGTSAATNTMSDTNVAKRLTGATPEEGRDHLPGFDCMILPRSIYSRGLSRPDATSPAWYNAPERKVICCPG